MRRPFLISSIGLASKLSSVSAEKTGEAQRPRLAINVPKWLLKKLNTTSRRPEWSQLPPSRHLQK
jgi:hypothetical protein